jgi:hypothetical protein
MSPTANGVKPSLPSHEGAARCPGSGRAQSTYEPQSSRRSFCYVLLGPPFSAAGVLDELIRGKVDRRCAGFRVVGTVEHLVGDARAVDDVPDQRAIDLGRRAHLSLEEPGDLVGPGEGPVEVVEVRRVVGEEVGPGVPVLEERSSHEVAPELPLNLSNIRHRCYTDASAGGRKG